MPGEVPPSTEMEERVAKLLQRELRLSEPPDQSIAINLDLGVDGDDAVSLLERLHGELGIDFSGFRFHEYFGDENPPLTTVIRVILGRELPLRPLTVRMLTDAAVLGRWTEPE